MDVVTLLLKLWVTYIEKLLDMFNQSQSWLGVIKVYKYSVSNIFRYLSCENCGVYKSRIFDFKVKSGIFNL